jgi:molybdenum cofactor cytidylyltransferase
MRTRTLSLEDSTGRVLSSPIFRSGGKKLLAKGHVLNDDDIRLLQNEGLREVWVTELDEGEVNEDEVVLSVATAMACGALEIRPAAGGRANLVAAEDICVVIDDDLLRQLNCTSSVVVATSKHFHHAHAGERVATVKSAPFAIPQDQLETVLNILEERGPIIQGRPIREPRVAVLYTDALRSDRGRTLFENVMRQRLGRHGVTVGTALCAVEEETAVTNSLEHLLRSQPTVVIVASTTAPASPDDVVGRAMCNVGCHIERFLAPVEPGNLMLLAYKDYIPVISSPGCYRSAKPNVLDLILPAMLAQYKISSYEIGALGNGGLLN